jgi:hypothetical protein
MTKNLTGMKKMLLHVAVSIALVMGMGLFARLDAQVVGATLSGTITDQSGAALPKADVSIRNSATGITRSVTTNPDGIYSAPNLTPGNYAVTVTAAGFAKTTANVTLSVGGEQVLNLGMHVGAVTESVEVTTEAPTVNLTNAEIGALTTETTIKELPLNGRSWSSLANLQPGVYQLHTQPDINTRDRFTRGYGAQLSISGARPQQNNYRVDGISINDPANGGPGNVLGSNAGVDAISEFSVLTTNYSTEYGRASGGVINATTKSGTNQFHGSAYEFLRNSYLDAPNFYDPAGQKPQFRRNQFGASAGGPIIKNRTFVFGDYEGLRQSKGLSYASLIPSATARTGADPGVIPYLNAFFPTTGSSLCAITVSGGITDLCSFGANQASTENYYIIRADHHISDKDSLSGTFYRDKSVTGTPDEYNNKVVNTAQNTTFATVAETHSFTPNLINSARFGYHRDFQGGPAGAIAINSKTSDPSFGAIPGFDAPQIFINNNFPIFTGGLTSFNPQLNHFNTYQFYDDAFLTKGKHSLKFGVSVERDQLNDIRSPRPGGIIAYASMAAFLSNAAGAKITTDLPQGLGPVEARQTIYGVYFQDDWRFRPNLTINLGLRYEPAQVPYDAQGKNATLLSIYDTTGTQLPSCGKAIPGVCNAQSGGLFKNNTLKDFSPRVGFAWDPSGNGKMSVRGGFGFYDQLPLIAFMGSSTNGNTAPFLASGTNNNLVKGSLAPAPANCGTKPSTGWPIGTPAYCQIATVGSNRVAFIDQNPKRAYVMQWNLSVQREIMPNLTALIGYVGSHGVHGTTQVDDVNEVLPISSGHLWPCDGATPFTGGNSNDCPGFGSGTTTNKSFGRLPATFFRNSSVYHGMMVQLTKAMSHGFQVQGSFTWQKSIDTASGAVISDSVITAISTLNWFDPRLTRGVSDFNDPKVLSVNYLWNVPTPKSWSGSAGTVAGGWQLGGIFSASAGQPFTPILAGDVLGLNNSDAFAYPDRLSGPGCQSLTNPGNVQYVKLQCFQIPGVTNVGGVNYIRLGNEGRNILTGPGLESFDFSVVKNTKVPRISEAFNVQFRLEVFNITNRANFNPPVANNAIFDVTTVTPGAVAAPGPTGACVIPVHVPPFSGDPVTGCLGGAGQLSGADHTSTDSRQMQVSLKVIW